MKKSPYELLCLQVNGPSCNWSLWRCTPRQNASLDTAWLANYFAK